MTSQISIRKLLKQEIRQNAWMFGLTGLLHLLTGPVVFLLNTTRYKNWNQSTAASRYQNFFNDSYFMWQLLAMLGCLAIGIFIYRYLFSRRMVDLYHSVPISRSRLFLTKYLHGFLIWFLPFVVNAGSVLAFYLFRSAGEPYFLECLGTLMKVILLLLLCFFIFYHLFLTAVYLSGNVLNLFANMAIIGCCVIGIVMAIFACAGNYFDTFCYEPSALLGDILYSLSPLTAPFAIYGYLTSDGLKYHVPLIIISVIICLGLLDVSWILCMKRPSELAERGTDSKRYITLSRIAATLLVGIAGALFFASISSNDQQLGWGIFGALLCSIVTFGALNSIYKTTIKAFFKHWMQLILTTAVSILIVVAFQLDWFGYDAYLPKKEDVAGMAIYSYQFTDGSTFTDIIVSSDGPTLSTTSRNNTSQVPQTQLLTDNDICYDLLETFVNDTYVGDRDGGYTNFYAKIKLKSGRVYERRYRIYDDLYEKLKPFVESEDYIAANYKYSTGAFGYPRNLTLELMNTSIDIDPQKNDLAETVIREFMDAYWADFAAHFSLENEASHMTLFSFSGSYTDGVGLDYNYFSLDVPMEYERTLAVVEKHYPEHPVTIETADEYTALFMNTNYYNKFINSGYTLNGLYEYFGYPEETSSEVDAAESSSEAVDDQSTSSRGTAEVEIVEIASADGKPMPTAAAVESYAELNITDEETLKELFPLLYFGNYRDMFEMKEYVHVGHVRTLKGNSMECYVKPGTMPKKIIQMLYEELEEYK